MEAAPQRTRRNRDDGRLVPEQSLLVGAVAGTDRSALTINAMGAKRRVVIVGAGGRLGAALAREYARDAEVMAFKHAQLDLGRPEQLQSTVGTLPFDALINAAALTNVDYCENHRAEAMQLNAKAP